MVYFCGLDGTVHAVGAIDGAPCWTWTPPTSGHGIDASPAVVDGSVYVGSGGVDGYVHAFEAATGRMRWSWHTGRQGASSPAVSDGLVTIGTTPWTLLALAAETGTPRWSYRIDAPLVPGLPGGPPQTGPW